MPNYEHRKIYDRFNSIALIPKVEDDFNLWCSGLKQLDWLKENASQSELVIYANSLHLFIHGILVPSANLDSIKIEDVLRWSGNPWNSRASLNWGGQEESVWIEENNYWGRVKSFKNARQLVFGRSLEGDTGDCSRYFEVLQEYVHASDIHLMPQRKAYSKYDDNGDVFDCVSMTTQNPESSIITFEQSTFQKFLVGGDYKLVRMFDFMLYNPDDFNGWGSFKNNEVNHEGSLYFESKADERGYRIIKGVQILSPRKSKQELYSELTTPRSNQYVDFVASDWRNKKTTTISTDPSQTTNYFEADKNELPFELSPAFFRPEVLLKYKADTDKYTVDERSITCRSAWHLRGYDINEAGQVHAYICDLRSLPIQEQRYWKGFNEQPKASISKRAFTNDFKGQFWSDPSPLERLKFKLQELSKADTKWWTLKEPELLRKINSPVTNSKDEWAEACMNITKLVVEGLNNKFIKQYLRKLEIEFEKQLGSISLFEKLLSKTYEDEADRQLSSLRQAQLIRSKVKGHSSGTTAKSIVDSILADHESFKAHFQNMCEGILAEIERIEYVL